MMMQKKSVRLRQLGKDRAEEVKFGRFLNNDKVTFKELCLAINTKVSLLSAGKHVLVVQDTTEVNYQKHVERVSGLGLVGNNKDVGFFLHPALVLDAESSTCLGLSAILSWVRAAKGDRKSYKGLPIEEKESYRWIEAAEESKRHLSEARMITVIADRESDIYEEWARIPDGKTHMITRASRDRRMVDGRMLYETISSFAVQGTYDLEVRARAYDKEHPQRSAHKARLELRFGEVEIRRSRFCTDKSAPLSMILNAVEVKELPETVLQGDGPVHWRLLTTHKVSNKEEALQIVSWYKERWNIEQLFRTLKKQGLDLESSQVEEGVNLQKLAVIALYIATIIMQMTLARKGQDQSIDNVFNENEKQFLLVLGKTLEGKTEKQKNPHSPKSLSWGSWIIARLGGWKGYASERPPGPITMKNGLKQFQLIYQGWELRKDVCIH